MAKERMAKWSEFLPLVLKDRQEHEIEATRTRESLATTGVSAEDNDDDAGADEAGSQYW
jgi:hypothetical protein